MTTDDERIVMNCFFPQRNKFKKKKKTALIKFVAFNFFHHLLILNLIIKRVNKIC